MVAVVTGNALGLLGSSKSVLGAGGQVGTAGLGQSGESLYVDGTTGNLVVQRQDEFLAGLGPNLGVLRTYNSQASFDSDNNDNWQLSLYRKLYNLTGTVNTAGSTIQRAGADGSLLTYTYDASRGRYVNQDGGGAYNTLSYDASSDSWTWIDGSSQTTETYAASPTTGEWRITSTADTNGNSLTYAYDGNGLINLITDANGESTRLDYNAARQLTAIDTLAGGVTTTRVRYTYDTQGRLSTVTTDLTPQDGSIADGQVFTTTYTYDGSSNRLASITNSDGTRTAITYDANFRVSTLTDGNGAVTTFTYGTGSTTVTDPLGYASTLSFDAAGNLTRLQGPAGSGQDVGYTYDAAGNLTQLTDSRGNSVTYTYDANGNLTRQQDSAGNVIERSYDAGNQLIAETTYATPAGTSAAANPQTTYYVRDSQEHLRFTVSPEGRVTEYRYNAQGLQTSAIGYEAGIFTAGTSAPVLSDLATWAAAQDLTRIQRTDTAYDARGQISSITQYAQTDATGTGIVNGTWSTTSYIYDAGGHLLQRIDPRGSGTANPTDYLTAYGYDGLGRAISVSQYDANGALARQTATTYTDGNRQVQLTLANGLTRVSTYDVRGLLITQVDQNGASVLSTTQYQYDADGRLRVVTDPAGGKRYFFYDALGRKIGEVDPTGALTETVYNGDGQVVRSIAYATAVSADLATLFAADASGNLADVALSAVRPATTSQDLVVRKVYDAAGQLRFAIDGTGAVTEYRYDGAGRVMGTLAYANKLNNFTELDSLGREATPADIQLLSAAPSGGWGTQIGLVTDAANDRGSRNLYDNDGRLRAVMDADGYLTGYQYDAAGHLVQTVRYATMIDTSLRANGTLDQLTASANANSVANLVSTRYYDGQGRLAGEVDTEGYLTTYAYDAQGNLTGTTRYANRLVGTATSSTLPTLLSSVPATVPTGGYVLLSPRQDQTVTQTWTAFNQLDSTVAADGTVTRNAYDVLGNRISTVSAAGTQEAATSLTRYDLQGRVVQTLSPLGAAALAALTSPTQAQIDAVWTSYGTTYSYDAAGRRTQSTDANGNVTWYFYDADNRLTFTVRRIADAANPGQFLGEVTERRYNTLGQVVADVAYANRLGNAAVSLLQGGSDAPLQAARATMTDTGNDSITTYAYDADGRLTTTTTALNATQSTVTTRTYDSFGELASLQTTIDAAHSRTDTYTYDHRGNRLSETDDAGGLNRRLTQTYDAFGRVTRQTDGRGITQTLQYDKLGRLLQTTQASGSLNLTRSSTFDAFGRVLSQTDATGIVTTYAYDTANRAVTTTVDPSGLNLVTKAVSNRRGQTLTLVDAAGNETRFAYDLNGNLLTQKHWDKASNTETTLTANTYDLAGLLLLGTTDANGNRTTFTYDAAGRVLTRSVDPNGLNLVTRYTYDAKGQTVFVTDPQGIVTQTAFDRAGRTIAVTVDPTGLNLQTQYVYDLAGERLAVTEGSGTATARTTVYQYDALGRRIAQVTDPTGLALTTLFSYDADNNLLGRLDAAGTTYARLSRYAYDNANRLSYTLDALGSVTRTDYDAEGRVLQTTAFATPVNASALPAQPSVADLAAAVTASNQDRVTQHRFDAAGRERFTIDPLGAVTEQRYDSLGNVTTLVRYATPLVGTLASTDLPQVAATAPSSGAYVLTSANDRTTTYTYDSFHRVVGKTEAAGTAVARTESWAYDSNGNVIRHTDALGHNEWFAFDAANRQTVHIDALGYETRSSYTADGKLAQEVRYMNAVALPASADDHWAYDAPTPVANTNAVSGDRTIAYVYDTAGRLAARTDASGVTTAYTYDALGNVVDTTVAAGTSAAVTLHRTYDLAGRVLTETHAYGTTDANTVAYTYDALGNQVSILTGVGTSGVRTTVQGFDLVGRKVSVTDGNGATVSTTYNAFGDIVKVTDANGYNGYFFADKLGRVTLQVDPEGAVTETRYDLLGNVTDTLRYANKVVGTVDEAHRPQLVSSPAASGPYVLTNSAADEAQKAFYDALGRKTEIRTWFGPGATDYYSERFTYDAAGNVLTATARNGAVTSYTYDADNRKVREVLPITSKNASGVLVPVENRYAYDAQGNLVTKIEAYGLPEQRTTQFVYDKLNRLVQQTGDAITTFDPVSGTDRVVVPTQTKIYDARGNVIEEVDARGGRTLHFYDHADREVGRVDAAGFYTAWTLDPVGNKISQTAYANAVSVNGGGSIPNSTPPATTGTVPAVGAYVLVDAANDRTTYFTYDAVGRQIGTRVDGVITGYYDTAAAIYRPTGNTTIFTQTVFDAAGNQVKTVDGNGNVTRTYYNRAGQRIGQVDAMGYLTTWSLDAFGNAVRQTKYANAVSSSLAVTDSTTLAQLVANVTPDTTNDRITETTYDKLNRAVSQTLHSVASGTLAANGALVQATADAVTRYNYDGLNNVTEKIDATGAVTDWTYDGLGRKTEEADAAFVDYRGISVRPTTDFEYNGLNGLTRKIQRGDNNATETDDRITAYAYGAGGYLASQTDPTGAVTRYRVDASGNVTQATLMNRVAANGTVTNDVTNYFYDALNRQIKSLDVSTNTTKEVRYNAFGQVTGKRTNGGGTDRAWTEFADYDKLGRIWRGNSGDGITKVWVYDKAGNATLKIDSPTADLTGLDLAHILALKSPVVNQTVSVFDARNQLIDTIQPTMIGDGHQTITIQQTLIEATGTVFTGVGNVALTEASGIGSGNSVTMPTATGAVSISRAQAVTATLTDSYSYSYDNYNFSIASASHSLTVGIPDSSALGSGNLRVHLELDSAQGLAGGSVDTLVGPTATSASLSFSENASGMPTSSRAYRYSIYKQTGSGEIQIASYSGIAPPPTSGSQYTSSTAVAMGNTLFFSGQRPDAARLILLTRPSGSNAGWTVTNAGQMQRNGAAVPGWFALDWSTWARGNYDVQYLVLDGSNNVVNAEQGQMVLSDTAPSVSQTVHTIGGAGRAFMTDSGSILFTEQGATAQSLTVLYRHAGTSEAWSSQVLSPASLAGTVTPGSFLLNTAGLTGRYEYTIEAKNAGGTTLNKGGATFTVGDSKSVLDPAGVSAQTTATASVGATATSVTNVSAVHTDTYTTGFNDNYVMSTIAGDHALTIGLPNTSAWGDGQVQVTASLQGFNISDPTTGTSTGNGGSATVWASSGQTSASLDISESLSAYTVPARAFAYGIYKQTDNGLIYLGGSDYSTSNPEVAQVSQNLVAFNVQPNTATRMLMQYRRAGSNSGWTITDVPPLMANGSALAGRFAFDWSGLAQGSYEFRSVAMDASGNIINSGGGTMNLQSGAPSVTRSSDLIGGAGRVFMDTSGKLNFTEQGTATQSITIRTRAAGSSGLWSTRQVLAPATIAGKATPGWFQFDPASAGLTGPVEYVIEDRNASGQVLQKTAGTFVTGQAGTVSDLQGYQEPAPVARFNQPVSAQAMTLSYRPAGSNGIWTQVSLPKTDTGVFDWNTANVFTSDSTTADYEYKYQTADGTGTIVNQAHGTIRLGSTPSVLSHVNDNLPTVVSFTPPAGNAVAASAPQMSVQYRLTGTTAWQSAVLTRTDLSKPFVLDVNALIPSGGLGSLDYQYTLQDASGTALTAADGTLLQVSGTLQVGTAADVAALTAVATGSTGPTVNLIHRQQAHNAFGEVVSETDGRGYATQLVYNTQGKILQKIDPQTTVVLANGFQTRQTPITSWIYDLDGNLIGERDANGNVTTQRLVAGDPSFDANSKNNPDPSQQASAAVAAEYHADGGVKQRAYDRLGNLRYSVDEIGRRTDYQYDLDGRLIRIDRPALANGVRAWDTYQYDAAGNRIRHSTTPDGSTVYSDTTAFDSQGRITATTSALGRTTSYSYVWKADTLGVASLRTGGWVQTTTDAMGRSLIDEKDTFGRVTRHADLSGRLTSYAYNQDGWLTDQASSAGQSIHTDYYANGYVKRIIDNALNTRTDYEYDDNGNRTYEAYQRTVNGVTEYLQNSTITYDELNRVKEVVDPRADILYEYDAMGNRRHVWSYYDNGVNGNTSLQDYWYAYDAMNRFTVTMGKLSTGNRGTSATDATVSIVAGSGGNGIALSYDLAGERKQATYASDGHTENYDFDGLGHLTNTWITPTGAAKYLAASRTNDLLGRVTAYTEFNSNGSQKYAKSTTYDADSRVLAQSGTDGSSTYYYYGSKTYNGADDTASASQSGAGELAKVVNTNSGTTTTTWTSYAYWDEAKEIGKTISGYNPVLEGNNGLWAPGMSSMTYDVNGHLVSSTDAGKDGTIGTGDDIRFQYVTNAQGIVLRRDQYYGSTLSKSHNYFYLDGQGVGDVGNDGDTVKDYAQVLAQPKLTKEQQYKNWKPISSADFDQNWQPVGPNYPGDTPTSYTVKSGDTLQGIAQAVWGDASLWYILADANGLSGTSTLTAGQTLTLPNKITNIHNNSTTFRPYEAGRIIGDNGPTLPDAPPAPVHNSGGDDGGCGGGSILVAIVVVVVAVFTQQYWIAQLGEWGGAVATAATADIAGQVTANAVGIQHGFDWTSLATSMVTAGIMSGLDVAGKLDVTSEIGKAMLNAAAANAVSQGINMAAGRQSSFDWTSLAVSAISAPVANSISSSLTGQGGAFQSAPNSTMYNVVDSTTHALVSAVTRLAVQGGKLNWEAVAADSIYGLQNRRWSNETTTTPAQESKATQQANEDADAKNGNVGGLKLTAKDVAAFNNGIRLPGLNNDAPITLDYSLVREGESVKLPMQTGAGDGPATQSVTAQRGDSISGLLGTSDPAAIGAFMRLNGLKNSNIYVGQDYTLPSEADISSSDRKRGQAALNRDNVRLAIQAEPVWSFREASIAQRKIDDANAAYLSRTQQPVAGETYLSSWDGVTRDTPAVAYLKSQSGGMDSVYAESTHMQLVRGIADPVNPLLALASGGYHVGEAMGALRSGEYGQAGLLFAVGAMEVRGAKFGGEGVIEGSVGGKNPAFFTSETNWTAPSRGTGLTYKVFQQEVDWTLEVNGITNLERAQAGNAPYVMKDGELQQLQLHHSRQNAEGPLFELSRSTHLETTTGQGREALHPYGNQQHPDFPVDRPLFKKDVSQYWRDRATGAQQ